MSAHLRALRIRGVQIEQALLTARAALANAEANAGRVDCLRLAVWALEGARRNVDEVEMVAAVAKGGEVE